MWGSSKNVWLSAGLLVAAGLSLGACATRAPGDIQLSQIKLDDDGGTVVQPAFQTGKRPGVASPIAQICAYPGGRDVLDRDLPGLTTRPEYVFFSHMSLKTLQGMSRGQLAEDDIRKVDADLRALP